MALRSGVTPTLVTIRCNPPMLMKNLPWYNIPLSRPHFQFNINESGSFLQVGEKEETPLVARKIIQELKAFFTEGCTA